MVEKPPTIANGTSGCTPLVGVLMLDTRFPRHPRDIGQSDGLPFAALHRRVPRPQLLGGQLHQQVESFDGADEHYAVAP